MLSLSFVMGVGAALLIFIIGFILLTFVMSDIDCDIFDDQKKADCKSSVNLAYIVVFVMPIAVFFAIYSVLGESAITELNIENVEKRAQKLQERGIDTLLRKSRAKLIDRSKRGNELYAMKLIPRYTLKYLKYEDPSTPDKTYGCFVPSEFVTADAAMAWKFYITEEEYNELRTEA